MLAPLDNEVVFKKAFTDPLVLKGFVRDDPPIGAVHFDYDIFAESTDKRIVVTKGPSYKFEREVFTIVVLTAPYSLRNRGGTPIKDNVLVSEADPRTLGGELWAIFGHRLIFLNPHNPDPNLPKPIQDWLLLILESIEPEEFQDESVINRENEAVARAADLIKEDNLTPTEREQMKIEVQKKLEENLEKSDEEKDKMAEKLRELGVDPDSLS